MILKKVQTQLNSGIISMVPSLASCNLLPMVDRFTLIPASARSLYIENVRIGLAGIIRTNHYVVFWYSQFANYDSQRNLLYFMGHYIFGLYVVPF